MVIIITILVVASTLAIAQQDPPTDKVALVNGVAITRSTFDREVSILQKRSAQQGQQLAGQQLAQAKAAILDRLVEGELLFQESKKQGIQVDPKIVDARLAEIKKRFPKYMKS